MFQKLSKIFLVAICICVAIYIGVFIGRTSSADMIPVASVEENPRVHRIDLNSASLEDLKAIPGVSSGVAKAIIEYRKEYGDYYAVKELLDIEGISKELYEQIKPYVKVSD